MVLFGGVGLFKTAVLSAKWVGVLHFATNTRVLPATGFDAAAIAIVAAVMIGAGLGFRRLARRHQD